MSVVIGIVVCYCAAVIIGKNTRQMKVSTYFIVGVIACLQVAIVIIRLFTFKNPLS